MIVLQSAKDCPHCQAVARQLETNRIAHRVESRAADDSAEGHQLVDDQTVIRGHAEMEAHVNQVVEQIKHWRRYQGDVCHDYGDDDNAAGCCRHAEQCPIHD